MNYLFYLGIIIPTVITIVLFLVFIYCWFLQKARKEVLTKRYDPHGKMRRLGMSMDPPSPPPYCRVGIRGDLFSDSSGEDNEAYDVSRSPSTEQNARGRPMMYRTYHDSGISAGLSLSPTQEGIEPSAPAASRSASSGGLAYRSCPDSGISGFGVHTMQTSACVHQHTCRGCCQDTTPSSGSGGENIQMQLLHHHQQQQQQPQIQLQQNQQQNQQQQLQMVASSSSFHQQQQQEQHQQQQQLAIAHQVMLHHNTIQASVHPNHGVCYGDDTTHPQSPQHYNPPPFHPHPHPHPHPQALEMAAMGNSNNNTSSIGNNNNSRQQSQPNVNILPHIQEQQQQQQQSTSCGMQGGNNTNNMCCNIPSPEHSLNNVTINQQHHQQQQQQQQQQQAISPQHNNSSCCNCQNHQHQHIQQQLHQQLQQMSIDNLPHSQSPLSQTCPPHPLHSDNTNNQGQQQQQQQQANYVNGEGGMASIDTSSAFRPKPFHPHHNKQPHDTNSFTTPTAANHRQQQHVQQFQPSYPSTSQCPPPIHSYRDSGVLEVSQPTPTNTNSSPSDRPDSQASTSSTTDSEDSGFRSSHCAIQPSSIPNSHNSLNKHGNPLLKPLRRPRNHIKIKTSKSDHHNKRSSNSKNNAKGIPANSTPLTTLNPQNLSSLSSPPHEDHDNEGVMQTTSLHEIGENGVVPNSRTAPPPRVLHLAGGRTQTISPNHNNSNSNNSRTVLQLSPTKEKDWSIVSPSTNDNETKTKRLQQHHQQQQQQQSHFDTPDISTHLSWKYLQDMSAASSKSNSSSDASNSSADDSHRVVSPLLRHAAPPEPSMDVFSYSVV